MSRPRHPQRCPCLILTGQEPKVHVSVTSGRRRVDGVGCSSEPWTWAEGRIGRAGAKPLLAGQPKATRRIDFTLAHAGHPPDTLPHGTDPEASRAREGGFVQRQII